MGDLLPEILNKTLFTFPSRITPDCSNPSDNIAPAVEKPIPGRDIKASISLGSLQSKSFFKIFAVL